MLRFNLSGPLRRAARFSPGTVWHSGLMDQNPVPMTVQGLVKSWSDPEGWGVLTSPEVPGDVFAIFHVVEGEGYKSLTPGATVRFDYEDAVPGGQYGCPFVATSVAQVD